MPTKTENKPYSIKVNRQATDDQKARGWNFIDSNGVLRRNDDPNKKATQK